MRFFVIYGRNERNSNVQKIVDYYSPKDYTNIKDSGGTEKTFSNDEYSIEEQLYLPK